MKKKIISGLVAVCVIVAAIFAYKFALGNSGTYVKDPSATEVQKAFDTLNNAYIEDGTQPEKYYTDFIADSSLSTGEGKHIASVMVEYQLKNIISRTKTMKMFLKKLKKIVIR